MVGSRWKRRGTQGNGKYTKQCVPKVKDLGDTMPLANHGGSESLQELGQGTNASGEGLAAVQRCSFTPNTAQKKVGFSGDTPKSASSLISPGEDFWNAAMEFADGVSAMADKGPKRARCTVAEDKSSGAVAMGSKTLPRSGQDEFSCENTVGSNVMKQIDEFLSTVELAANGQHENNSPLPVKHLNFFHEDGIQVSGLEGKEKGGTVPGSIQVNQGRLTESSFHRTENLMHSVDEMKRVTSYPDTNTRVMIPGEGLFKSKTAGSALNQLTHGETKLIAASKPNRDSKSMFASQRVESSTPTSSVPPKDHSKLSTWLPPQLCAIYMKKGISRLYPWQTIVARENSEEQNVVCTGLSESFVTMIVHLNMPIFNKKKIAVKLKLKYASSQGVHM